MIIVQLYTGFYNGKRSRRRLHAGYRFKIYMQYSYTIISGLFAP